MREISEGRWLTKKTSEGRMRDILDPIGILFRKTKKSIVDIKKYS